MNLNEHNLKLIEELVSTQYDDYNGYVAIDGHMGADLHKMCEDYGIDKDKYFLIRVTFREHTIDGIGMLGHLSCTAIVIEKSKYGNTFDEIRTKLSIEKGKAKAKRISFNMKYSELAKYINRIDLGIVTKMSRYISNIEFDEE